ncbi:MAG: hypothetical protein VW738_02170 [Pseudomonadales bacterium]
MNTFPARSSLVLALLLAGCTAKQPDDIDNLCAIFGEYRKWYGESRKAADRWGTTIPIIMAFIHQESSFKAKAKPPRTKILWVIPGPRPASAKGYSQAIDGTWTQYQRATGRFGADRSDFGDAADFVGWYVDQSAKKSGIKKDDAYNLYLAYHEGQGGFQKGTYKNKAWLVDVAKKVAAQSKQYGSQLKNCEKKFKRRFFFF